MYIDVRGAGKNFIIPDDFNNFQNNVVNKIYTHKQKFAIWGWFVAKLCETLSVPFPLCWA